MAKDALERAQGRNVSVATDHDKRVARIRRLADELHTKCDMNTIKARQRCVDIARELIELLKAENGYQRGHPMPVENRALGARTEAARREAHGLLEQTSVRHMYSSRRPHHDADD